MVSALECFMIFKMSVLSVVAVLQLQSGSAWAGHKGSKSDQSQPDELADVLNVKKAPLNFRLPPIRSQAGGKSQLPQDSEQNMAHPQRAGVSASRSQRPSENLDQAHPQQQQHLEAHALVPTETHNQFWIHDLSELVSFAEPGDWAFFELDQVILSYARDGVEPTGTPVGKLFTPNVVKVLNKLRRQGVKLFGLTSRALEDCFSGESETTLMDDLVTYKIVLDSVDFKKEKGNPKNRWFYQRGGVVTPNGRETYSGYCSGIIYTNGQEKAESLDFFLYKLQQNGIEKPSRILFVDSKAESVTSVSRYLDENSIDSLSFHLSPVKYSKFVRAGFRRARLPRIYSVLPSIREEGRELKTLKERSDSHLPPIHR